MQNSIITTLYDLGISEPKSLCLFHPKVRDKDDIAVMKCLKSGVLVLSQVNHINSQYYAKQSKLSYWDSSSREQAKSFTLEDDQRRALQFKDYIFEKKWLDVGTGVGGILDLLKNSAAEIVAVEPQEAIRKELIKQGYKVFSDIREVPESDFDVITLFHVFEHFTQPLITLKDIAHRLRPGGQIIIEVPHANDFLISFLNLESFKSHTFWSEHLILHTRDSLRIFLENTGFKNISITGFQRYPLANHLHWLAQNKPGGHHVWSQLTTPGLDKAYAAMLDRIDKTDTLIAVAEK